MNQAMLGKDIELMGDQIKAKDVVLKDFLSNVI